MKTKTQIWLLIILAIIIIVLTCLLLLPKNTVQAPAQNSQTTNNQTGSTIPVQLQGIQVTTPVANAEVSSPINITGTTNAGGWSGFEGQVGTVQLLDNKGNKIATGILKATTDWTKSPTSFESTITFTSKYKGPATLFFTNENPSGIPSKTKNFGLSVIIK